MKNRFTGELYKKNGIRYLLAGRRWQTGRCVGQSSRWHSRLQYATLRQWPHC